MIEDEKFQEAIRHLDQGGTKKKACEILGIKYNTKRLGTLIEDYERSREASKRLRAKKRKEALSKEDLAGITLDYLRGDSFADLSDNYFRSVETIKYHLNKHGLMMRHIGTVDRLDPPELPEESMADSFGPGDFVWAAKYNCVAKVVREVKSPQCKAYLIRVISEGIVQFSAQPVYELGCLKHVEALGVNLANLVISDNLLSDETIQQKINEAVREGNKRK